MNDRDRRQSGRLMLISPERVFYAGLLGKPRQRSSGGYNIYIAVDGRLTVTEGRSESVGEVAMVTPYTPHSVDSEHRCIICLVIEPESVEQAAMQRLAAKIRGPAAPQFAQRVRAAYENLRSQQRRAGFTTEELDGLFFGALLPPRNMDRRIRRAASRLGGFSESKTTAADYAASAGLSSSRFLHLFKEQTGISFRAFRAWKRARHLLHFVNEDINLAHLAQDIGYPDSTISAIRSGGSTACSRAPSFPARAISRSTAAIPACSTARVFARAGRDRAIAAGRKYPPPEYP